MYPLGIIDLNVKEIEDQYREYEDIVTIEDIVKLMNAYNIESNTLSLILGLKEDTISRYLQGSIPTKEISDVIKKAISIPSYFVDKLDLNKSKINKSDYEKSLLAAKI